MPPLDPNNAGPLRLMSVHAHPDDESSKGAATCARYVAEGQEVMVVTCTGGEAGSILNPAMDRPDVLANMPAVRRAEMAAGRRRSSACSTAGWGSSTPGCPRATRSRRCREGCFALVDLEEATGPLVALIREFRPHVLVTYDERGGYPHPDHIKCHEISVAAFDAAGDPDRFPGAGDPWQPLKLYYSHGFSKARLVAFHEALLARGLESPYGEWLENWKDDRPDPGSAGDHPGAVRRLVRACVTRPSRRTPPRSTRPALVLASRRTSSGRSGPPRTTSWCARSSTHRSRRTICSPGCTSAWR